MKKIIVGLSLLIGSSAIFAAPANLNQLAYAWHADTQATSHMPVSTLNNISITYVGEDIRQVTIVT